MESSLRAVSDFRQIIIEGKTLKRSQEMNRFQTVDPLMRYSLLQSAEDAAQTKIKLSENSIAGSDNGQYWTE